MAEQPDNKKTDWKVWLLVLPLLLAALPLIRYALRLNSGNIELSNEEYSEFNRASGVLKNTRVQNHPPELPDTSYSVHYRGAAENGAESAAQMPQAENKPNAGTRAPEPPVQRNGAPSSDAALLRKQEQLSVGYSRGLLLSALSKVMEHPAAVSALFNNSMIVNGFMSRPAVQKALSSPEALDKLLSDPKVINNFLGNKTVKKAAHDPRVLDALVSSALASSIMGSKALKETLKNPAAASALMQKLAANPKVTEFISNPKVLNALMTNPDTALVLQGAGLAPPRLGRGQ
jgi:hypothetical protein